MINNRGIWLCLAVVAYASTALLNGAGAGAALLAVVAIIVAIVLGVRSER